jgi:hypothetical protein
MQTLLGPETPLPQAKLADRRKRPSWQARIAFALSIISVLMTIYQWWSGQKESIVAATIDITKKHLSDPQMQRAKYQELDFWYHLDLSQIDAPLRYAYHDNLNYIAELILSKRIDPNYMPEHIICDMWNLRTATDALLARHAQATQGGSPSALTRVAESYAPVCSKKMSHLPPVGTGLPQSAPAPTPLPTITTPLPNQKGTRRGQPANSN